jgi:predicted transcriptional regulator
VLVGELDDGQDVTAVLARGLADAAEGRHHRETTSVHSGVGRVNGWGTRPETG